MSMLKEILIEFNNGHAILSKYNRTIPCELQATGTPYHSHLEKEPNYDLAQHRPALDQESTDQDD